MTFYHYINTFDGIIWYSIILCHIKTDDINDWRTIYNDIFSYINNPSKDTVGIWKFCLKTQKWTKLFDFDYKDVTATLSHQIKII